MSADRELLEAAARAAGIVIKRSRLDDPLQADMLIVANREHHHSAFLGWNPLTDDGDNRRLQVKLKMGLIPVEGGGWDATTWDAETGEETVWACDTDPNRAVVRAAAELGRAVAAKTGKPE